MLKALMKKQLLEINSFYFMNKKTGKMRSKAGIAGFTVLYIFLFALLGFLFYGVARLLEPAFFAAGLDWLYFCMMGMLSIAMGTFGSVFNTFAGLYLAKDNDLLLSMPIPPYKILFSRLVSVYSMSLLYTSLVWIPTVLRYFISGNATVSGGIFSVLQLFIITLFVTVLTCALGWVVALISSKLKNKSFITVIFTLVFIGAYYLVYFRINAFLQSIVNNAEFVGNKIKSIFYPFYLMGLASKGEILPMLAVIVIVAILSFATFWIMSKTFLKITTTKKADKKAEVKKLNFKSSGMKSALLHKELKKFTSSSVYMLNCGIGAIIIVVCAVVLLIKTGSIRELLSVLSVAMPGMETLIPVFASAVISLMMSTNQITAPSVSLEGKNLWILQSMPVNPKDVLSAKQKLHIIINMPVAVIGSAVFAFVIKADFTTAVYMIVFSAVYVLFTASFGLFLNLKMPNVSWTNETVPIKQGAPVAIGLFGSWGLSIVFAGVGYLLFAKTKMDMTNYIFYATILLVFVTGRINKWIEKTGTVIFSTLK